MTTDKPDTITPADVGQEFEPDPAMDALAEKLRELLACMPRRRSPIRSVGWGWLDGDDEDFKQTLLLSILFDRAVRDLEKK